MNKNLNVDIKIGGTIANFGFMSLCAFVGLGIFELCKGLSKGHLKSIENNKKIELTKNGYVINN